MEANAWLYDVDAKDLNAHINSLIFLARQATQHLHANALSATFSAEHARAFQRVYDMLSAAMPHVVQTQHASSSKGAAAERALDERIADSFPDWTLHDTAQQARCGDRLLVMDAKRIMIEYKDYKNTVPSKEVQKFERDMRACSVQVGVMCVFQTNIARKPAHKITFSCVGNAIAIFLPNADREGTKLLLALEFATWLSCSYKSNNDVTHETDKILQIASECLGEVDTLQRELATVADHMAREQQRLNEARLTCLTSLRTRLEQITHHVASE